MNVEHFMNVGLVIVNAWQEDAMVIYKVKIVSILQIVTHIYIVI